MKVNFRGLVDLHSLPTTEPLLPLFEALINSLQSIEEAGIDNGRIDIIIEREPQLTMDRYWETDIDNIIIEDNGMGFTEAHYISFDTYASDLKIKNGCKGVGRILWLKAFTSVEVDSIYSEGNGNYWRTFCFDSKKAVYNMKHELISNGNDVKRKTVVKLIGLNSKLRRTTPKKLSTIARDILNHCFLYFFNKKMPLIYISDDTTSLCINTLFDEYKKENLEVQNFSIKGEAFSIVHSRNHAFSSASNFLNYCAHNRRVTSVNLSSILNGNDGKFTSKDGDFVYAGYLVAQVLDDSVNSERTEFSLPAEPSGMFEDVSKKEILEATARLIQDYLKEDILKYNENKAEFIRKFIFEKNPRYRYLLKNHPEFIESIQWLADDDKMEIELFKQEQQYKLKLKIEGRNLQKEVENGSDIKGAIQRKTHYAEKITEMGKSALAEYVLHRKTVLEILDNNLTYQDDDTLAYAYEESIHQLIFPMQKTSDDIDYQSHNLWIVDEKLSYQYYLASDKKLNSMQPLDSESGKEPDILIFDSPFAFSDEDTQPFRNITIIEFKRPGRDDFTESKNPIQQIVEYMDDILAGGVKTRDGRQIERSENLRFFCYILCVDGATMKKYARQRDFKLSPDGMGYYDYFDRYNALVEIIIPYTKLIQDSKKRNKILFDKLFMQ